MWHRRRIPQIWGLIEERRERGSLPLFFLFRRLFFVGRVNDFLWQRWSLRALSEECLRWCLRDDSPEEESLEMIRWRSLWRNRRSSHGVRREIWIYGREKNRERCLFIVPIRDCGGRRETFCFLWDWGERARERERWLRRFYFCFLFEKKVSGLGFFLPLGRRDSLERRLQRMDKRPSEKNCTSAI